jgi:hypothetical protein
MIQAIPSYCMSIFLGSGLYAVNYFNNSIYAVVEAMIEIESQS